MTQKGIDWCVYLVNEYTGHTTVVDFGDVDVECESPYWDAEKEDRMAKLTLIEGLTTPGPLPDQGLYLVDLEPSDSNDEIRRLYWVHAKDIDAETRLINWHPGLGGRNSHWKKVTIRIRPKLFD